MAWALDSRGRVLSGRTIAWTTSNSAVATVSPSGIVTGLAAGTATISATSEGIVGTGKIVVLQRLTATCVRPWALPTAWFEGGVYGTVARGTLGASYLTSGIAEIPSTYYPIVLDGEFGATPYRDK